MGKPLIIATLNDITDLDSGLAELGEVCPEGLHVGAHPHLVDVHVVLRHLRMIQGLNLRTFFNQVPLIYAT